MSNFNAGSAGQAGSPAIANAPVDPNAFGSQAGQASNGTDYQAMYAELESKLGTQGRELGEYRSFFEGIAPLLDKLDKSPELVQAIVDGKIDADLAKAALEGKITVGEAQIVNQAHAEVKKELGKKAYENLNVDDIDKLIESKVQIVRQEMEGKAKESDEMRDFERNVQDFIERTPDFTEYAKEIDDWLDEHDTTDIAVAYYAVKGQVSEREAKKQAQTDANEAAKNYALNAGGGHGGSSFVPGDSDIVDQLIAGKSNPNVF
jgi:soluble cytochrome b562